MIGTLVGVGVGPGDPEHLTLKAVRVLREADRVFVPETAAGPVGRAERAIEGHVDRARVQRLRFAMADEAGRDGSWDRAGAAIAAVVQRGGTAAFATLGDPNLFSTFTYVVQSVRALVAAVRVETVPGITAMQDLAARSGTVLAEGVERLALVPYTSGDARLRDALAGFDTVVVYKGGRQMARVIDAVRDAGRLDAAVYGHELGTGAERVSDGSGAAARAPYLSTVIVPAARSGVRGEKL